MATLRLSHKTVYRYSAPVRLLPHRLQLRPRESRELKLLTHHIVCVPPAELSWSKDVFGNENAIASFAVDAASLTIESFATVELSAPAWPVFNIDASAISYPFRYAGEDWTDLGSLTVPQYADSADKLGRWARGLIASSPTDTLSLLKDLNLGVHRQIAYQSRDDEGTQSPAHTLLRGWGSCRDLSVLLVEAARTLGFGARVVSGYLLPDGLHNIGAGSTHAWAEVYLPGPGWISFDPTNGTMGGAGLIPTTVARVMSQAVPAAGSFVSYGAAFERMDVEVIVREIPALDGGNTTTEHYRSSSDQKDLPRLGSVEKNSA